MTTPDTFDDVCRYVREHSHVRVCGAGTKPGLSAGASVSTAALSGIVEYDPHEFVITVQAGMTLRELQRELAARGQVLPFDPPFAAKGATIAGTVAGGLSGAGRMRYGGVRDFLLGVTFVDATGRIIRGGGRVVKNAAGFDLPKLMIGSAGDLGILLEVTFKVFPEPERRTTLIAKTASENDAVAHLSALGRGAIELEALDLVDGHMLAIRVGGRGRAVRATIDRLATAVGGSTEVLDAGDEARYWQDVSAFSWAPPNATLLKAPLRPTAIPACEAALRTHAPSSVRRYSAGGHLLWVALADELSSDSVQRLGAAFAAMDTALIGLAGPHAHAFQPPRWSGAFGERLRQVFDPTRKFTSASAAAGDSGSLLAGRG